MSGGFYFHEPTWWHTSKNEPWAHLPLRRRTQWRHPPVLRYIITRRSSQTVSNRLRAATDLIRQVLGIGEHRYLRTTGAGSNELAYQASWVVLRDWTSSKSRNTPDREWCHSHQSPSFLSVFLFLAASNLTGY